jgi:hypothetical protein
MRHNPFSALRKPVEVVEVEQPKEQTNTSPISNPFSKLRKTESIDTYVAYIRHVYHENFHLVQWAMNHQDRDNVRDPLLSLQECIKKAKQIAEINNDMTELDKYTYEMDLVFEVLGRIYEYEKGTA